MIAEGDLIGADGLLWRRSRIISSVIVISAW